MPPFSRVRSAVLFALALGVMLGSAARFGFRATAAQCPTAPVQTVAIMTRAADGSMVREVRAPRPGEKDYVVCHCQAKRAAAQTGWFVPSSAPVVLASILKIEIPLVVRGWVQPEQLSTSCDPPVSQISHPPSV